MRSTRKILIGVLTILPIFFMIMYFVQFFSMFTQMGDFDHPGPDVFFGNFKSLFMYILLATVLSFGMMIYYIIDIANNPKFIRDSNSKLVWILVVLFGSFLGMIAYFIVEIYPRRVLPPLPNVEDDMV